MTQHHILILGGTAEAREIATRLAGEPNLTVTSSLAGRTMHPLMPPGAVRVGGFGGAAGLADWLAVHAVRLVVDATHPFAAQISANAREATHTARVPLLRLRRAPWKTVEGDRWIRVHSVGDAATALGTAPRRVFLAIGRQEVAPFAGYPQHRYIVRSVEPVEPGILANAVEILDRGPFDETAERTLMLHHGVEIVVAKNSGGGATYAKIAAARDLGLPVIMIERPDEAVVPAFEDVEQIVRAVHQTLFGPAERGE